MLQPMRLGSAVFFAALALVGLTTSGCRHRPTRHGDTPGYPPPTAPYGAWPPPSVAPSSGPSPAPPPSGSTEEDPARPEGEELQDEVPLDETPRDALSQSRETPIASRYASLDRASCENELRRRGIAFQRLDEARGVIAPLRLTGPLFGVTFRSNFPPAKARQSPYDIYDCRLVLALEDFARILSRYGIVEVVHMSVYRPVSPKVPMRGPGRRHSGALAIDAAFFKTRDGRTLSVEKDFQPRRIGARPCPAPAEATELRHIACEAGNARLFNVLLTPDFNWAHRNHFHLEVTAGVRWTLIR
jgi:hypothetical protein